MCRGPAGLWVNTELLLWWMRGMHVPPLVTTGSLNDAQPGALGQPGTQIVFGDEDINDRLRAGGRLQFGWTAAAQSASRANISAWGRRRPTSGNGPTAIQPCSGPSITRTPTPAMALGSVPKR
jgi:hypothetical protein